MWEKNIIAKCAVDERVSCSSRCFVKNSEIYKSVFLKGGGQCLNSYLVPQFVKAQLEVLAFVLDFLQIKCVCFLSDDVGMSNRML